MDDYYDPIQEEINEEIRREHDFEEEFGCSPGEYARREAELDADSMDDADRDAMNAAFDKDD